MKTIFLVQGEHHTVPGNPMSAHATEPLAAAAARALVNIIRQDALYDPVTGDYSLILPQLDGEFDWREALREWQRAKIADDYEPADIAGMDDVGLADATETDVWITELELELSAPVEPDGAVAALVEAAEEAAAMLDNAIGGAIYDGNEPADAPERVAVDAVADAIRLVRASSPTAGGGVETDHMNEAQFAAFAEAHTAGAGDPERLHALDNARYPDDAPGAGCDDPALMGDGGPR
jgi:hypothetical protein